MPELTDRDLRFWVSELKNNARDMSRPPSWMNDDHSLLERKTRGEQYERRMTFYEEGQLAAFMVLLDLQEMYGLEGVRRILDAYGKSLGQKPEYMLLV